MSNWVYIVIYMGGLLAASFSQILLKISAKKEYSNKLREYLNGYVIISYFIFFCTTLCTMYAYKGIPLSLGPILAASEYIIVALLSRLLLKEKMRPRKYIGLLVIIFGIIIYSL